MLSLQKPDDSRLAALRDACRDLPFNYSEQCCTRGEAPPGYNADEYRVRLGTGPDTFADAHKAIHSWQMLQFGWVTPCWPDAPIVEGALVATCAQVFGLWFVNVCRIVYVDDHPGRHFAFAYGTIPGHVERGEERFAIDLNADDGAVWFSIRAHSRPGSLLTYLGYPLTRRLQRCFGRDSLAAMTRAISPGPGPRASGG